MKRTIPSLFRAAVDDTGDSTWLLAGDQSFTYGEALDRVRRAAGGRRATGVG